MKRDESNRRTRVFAWFKRHFPAKFMAAGLINGKGFYHPLVFVLDCYLLELKLAPPSVNEPGPGFDPHGQSIRIPLFKGLTERATDRLLVARTQGSFASLLDFYVSVTRSATGETRTVIIILRAMITARESEATAVVAAAVLPKLSVIADTKGRLRVTPAQRRDILTAFGRSGESLPGFARRTGLKYSTLARWVQHRRPKPSGRKPAFRLLEALVPAAPGSAPGPVLVVQLPGGARVEVADAAQVALAATLVRALAQPC